MYTQQQIQNLVSVLVSNYQPEKVILFGSYAAEKQSEDSDVDLLVVKQTTEKPHIRGREALLAVRGTKVAADILVYTPQELDNLLITNTSFESEILKQGKVLYAR